MTQLLTNDSELIRASKLFDGSWYCDCYKDVQILGIDPAIHYLSIGAALGRDPSPAFSTQGYIINYPDVAETGINPLVHYLKRGQHEGRSVTPTKGARIRASTTSNAIPRRKSGALKAKKARIIAFHLPQFHPFKENDAWWGKGFTEWTNVDAAQPQFVGHYQPHAPHDDIGHYSLLDRDAQSMQIELAKTYGVEGFCFYYYWFDGHRLMEKPIDNYLSDTTLDHPFCLCWANENWSRRWDGLESEILIAQNHSPEDDVRCIEDLARYLKDSRYIKINGKPLILIYRPSLLPNAFETTVRWRAWCRENGLGEIYLAYTQSFEKEDPRKYGFDAAIEFPPNNSSPPDVTDTVIPISNKFSSTVYDWRILVERSKKYNSPEYKIFRSVCPGWDNTARRKERGIVFINNTPELYQHWLENSIVDTCERFADEQERIVFVNAWNEWAEGAHLEPDQINGYAYLEATRRAVEAVDPEPKIALAIHAFYPDTLVEILDICEKLQREVIYYVTTIPELEGVVRRIMKSQSNQYRVIALPNRGRDILPFLHTLEYLIEDGIEIVAKVHTKRSLHRQDGDQWRNELYEAVIGRESFGRAIEAMQEDPQLGMLGPEGHLVSMDTYLGSNRQRIVKYAKALGVSSDKILEYSFFAGTMFVARVQSLQPLLSLGIGSDDFEDELGQIDGTLAHAIERILTVCVASQGYRLAFTADPNGVARVNTRYGFA